MTMLKRESRWKPSERETERARARTGGFSFLPARWTFRQQEVKILKSAPGGVGFQILALNYRHGRVFMMCLRVFSLPTERSYYSHYAHLNFMQNACYGGRGHTKDHNCDIYIVCWEHARE